MQLNMSEYDDLPFDINEMNDLASSINNFETYDPPVLSRNQNNNATAKETEFLNLGPGPRTAVKRPVTNPIIDRIKNAGKNVNNNNSVKPVKPFVERPHVIDYQPSKTDVTYDDLLANMNVVIRNGVMYRANNIQAPAAAVAPAKQIPQKTPAPVRLHQQQPKNMKVPKGGNYILNKYFKDHIQEEEKIPIQVPRTKEEYRKMMIIRNIKMELERRRIDQIKPKTMLFNNQNFGISQGLGLGPEQNKLFRVRR
jgi:hypothetical protein